MVALSDIQRLLALEEIHLLKARRDRAVDAKDWATYEALHAPDHHSYNEDYAAWTTAVEMIANLRVIMSQLVTTHHSHTPEIDFESPAKASGIWAMKGVSLWQQDGQEHWFIGWGHYFETYEKRDGRWLFSSRRLKYIHTRASPGAIFPPPAASSRGGV
jgi:hypothetical protein